MVFFIFLTDDHCLTLCSGSDELHRNTDVVLNEADVILRILRKLLKGLAVCNALPVAVQLLVYRLGIVEHIKIRGKVLHLCSVDIVSNADLDLVKLADRIQMVYRKCGKTVDTLCVF